MQDELGQINPTHSVSAGLDYPGVGPEHAWLKDQGRVRYTTVDDESALKAFDNMCLYEGIIPALETSHALAEAEQLAGALSKKVLSWLIYPEEGTRIFSLLLTLKASLWRFECDG